MNKQTNLAHFLKSRCGPATVSRATLRILLSGLITTFSRNFTAMEALPPMEEDILYLSAAEDTFETTTATSQDRWTDPGSVPMDLLYASSTRSSSGSNNSDASHVDRSEEYDDDPEDPSSDEDETGRTAGDRYTEAMASLAAGRLQYLAIPSDPLSPACDQSLYYPSTKRSRKRPTSRPHIAPSTSSFRSCGHSEVPETIEEESEGETSPSRDNALDTQHARRADGTALRTSLDHPNLLSTTPDMIPAEKLDVHTVVACEGNTGPIGTSDSTDSGSKCEGSWEELAAPSIMSQATPRIRKRLQLRLGKSTPSVPLPEHHHASTESLIVPERATRKGLFKSKRLTSQSRHSESASPRPSALGLFTPSTGALDDSSTANALPELCPDVIVLDAVLAQSATRISGDGHSAQIAAPDVMISESLSLEASPAAFTAKTRQRPSSFGGQSESRIESDLRTLQRPLSAFVRVAEEAKDFSRTPRRHLSPVPSVVARSKSLEQCRVPVKACLLLGIDQPDCSTAVPVQPRIAADHDWSEEEEQEEGADDEKCEEKQTLRKQAARQRSMELLTGSRRESTAVPDEVPGYQSEQCHDLHTLLSSSAYEGEIIVRWCCGIRAGSDAVAGAKGAPVPGRLSTQAPSLRPLVPESGARLRYTTQSSPHRGEKHKLTSYLPPLFPPLLSSTLSPLLFSDASTPIRLI